MHIIRPFDCNPSYPKPFAIIILNILVTRPNRSKIGNFVLVPRIKAAVFFTFSILFNKGWSTPWCRGRCRGRVRQIHADLGGLRVLRSSGRLPGDSRRSVGTLRRRLGGGRPGDLRDVRGAPHWAVPVDQRQGAL